MGIARRSDRRRAARRLFLSRTHFSAEKTRGARAQTVGMFLWTSQATGAGRVLLVGAASLPRARVRPTPQETVATLKFSTKKLVVAHPRLEEVFPLFRETRFKLELFFSQAQGESHAIVTTRPKLELMLKYFNENISQALQERYRDLHEYRKTEAVEEGSPREAKIPKIAEEGENLGGGGAFENAAPPFARLLEQPKEEDSFVASWLHNSFKMTAAEGNHPPNNTETPGGSALDLRAAPLSLHIPALQQAEAQRQFKMEFWNRSRPGSPETHDQLGPPPTPQPPATPDHKTMTEKLVNEIQVSLLNFLENLWQNFENCKGFFYNKEDSDLRFSKSWDNNMQNNKMLLKSKQICLEINEINKWIKQKNCLKMECKYNKIVFSNFLRPTDGIVRWKT